VSCEGGREDKIFNLSSNDKNSVITTKSKQICTQKFYRYKNKITMMIMLMIRKKRDYKNMATENGAHNSTRIMHNVY
jgi:hypothetical protein